MKRLRSVADSRSISVTLTASIGSVVDNGDGTWSWSLDTAAVSSQQVTITARDFANAHLDDCAMQRVLGASQRSIALQYLVEFGVIGVGAYRDELKTSALPAATGRPWMSFSAS